MIGMVPRRSPNGNSAPEQATDRYSERPAGFLTVCLPYF